MDDPTTEDNQRNTTPPPSYPSNLVAREQESARLAEKHNDASASNNQPSTQSAWVRWQNHTLSERVMAYFTGVVAICAALQIWILIGGSGQTDQLIKAANINACAAKQIAAAADRNATAAETFAIAAQGISGGITEAVEKLDRQARDIELARQSSEKSSKDALDTSIRASRNDQRAWVGYWSSDFRPGLVVGQPLKINLELRNSGKTPALDVQASTYTAQGTPNIEVHPNFSNETSGDDIDSKGVIQPNGTLFIPINYPIEITQPLINKVKTGIFTIYIISKITYLDVFQRPHYTTYCVEMNRTMDSFNSCRNYNDTDHEKEDKH
jgi:hypothetical protein